MDDKTKALLEKVRRGTTASFTMAEAETVLTALGYKLEREYGPRRKLEAVTVTPPGGLPARFEKIPNYKKLNGNELLSSSANVNGAELHYGPNPLYARLLVDSATALGAPTWAEEQEDKLLYGVRAGDIENTGTCGCCFAHQKLNDGHMVHHGYRRPGDGSIYGDCSGVGIRPLEVSPAGPLLMRDALTKTAVAIYSQISRIEAGGDITIDEHRKLVTYKSGDERYPAVRKARLDHLRYSHEQALKRRDAFAKLCDEWVPDELPEVRIPKKAKLKLYPLIRECC